jgi:tRNA pseudouridine13 synthase
MRLKVSPGDFRVTEELDWDPAPGGEYYVHVLRKEKLDTPGALALVAREAGVERADIAFAGLKDRQGRTEQWITIRGKRFDYHGEGLDVRFKGRTARPLTSKMSTGNRFEITVRDLGAGDVARVARRLPVIARCGFPNYFDDQRFGCLRHGQGFAQRNVLRGEWETALHRLLARPSRVAISGDVKLKQSLSTHWGDWQRCASIARGPLYGRVFQHLLREPADFRGALALLPTRMKLIHAYAWQSFVWNRATRHLLEELLPRDQQTTITTAAGTLCSWKGLERSTGQLLDRLATPLFAPGAPLGAPRFAAAVRRVLAEEGVDPTGAGEPIPGMELRTEPRTLRVLPRDLRCGEPMPDRHNRGRLAIELSFGLPRGSYATLLVKCLFEQARRERGARPRPRTVFRRPRRGENPAS